MISFHISVSRSSTPDPNLILDMNNNKETDTRGEMRERKARREGREIPETEVFERQEPRVRRKVSRVESLKRILFNRSENDEKKRRSKSAEAELKRSTVDKGCGPDMDAEDMYSAHARASCLDLSSEIGEFDSVSQISCMDNHDRSVHRCLPYCLDELSLSLVSKTFQLTKLG